MVPFFSIIVPTYNSSRSVSNSVQSIISQTFADFEILIIDGLSTDNTIEKVTSFNDKRIKIYAEKDAGIYDAMNKGINLAKGSWLYFLGSDDKLYRNTVLENIYKKIISLPDCFFLYGNSLISDNNLWAQKGQVYDGEFDRNKLFAKNICHQSIFYKKEIFEKIGKYNIAYNTCADWDLNHRCFATYSVNYVDMIIAEFDATGTSSFLKTKDRFIEYDYAIRLANYYNLSLNDKVFAPFFQSILNSSIFEIREGKILKGIRLFSIAFFITDFKVYSFRFFLKNLFKSA